MMNIILKKYKNFSNKIIKIKFRKLEKNFRIIFLLKEIIFENYK